MSTRILIGLVVILISVALLSVLVSWKVGFTVGLLILLSLVAGAVIRRQRVSVQDLTAQVVCHRQHGGVLRIIQGPAVKFLCPLREVAGPAIGTENRSKDIHVSDIFFQNQQPTPLNLEVTVMFRLVPHQLDLCQLREHLPVLTGSWPQTIRRETEYYLPDLVADMWNQGVICNRQRRQLERQLKHKLIGKLGPLGIEVTGLQLVIKPVPGLQTIVQQVACQEVTNRMELESLNDLLRTMGGQEDATRNLALLLVAQGAAQDGQVLTWLDLAKLLNRNSFVRSEKRPDVPVQLGLLPKLLRPIQTQ